MRIRELLGWAMAVGAVVFLAFAPARSDLELLSWDMSHHMLGAERLAAAMVSGDGQAVVDRLLERDLYPPGHSLLLGTWLCLFGDSTRSWLVFQLGSLLSLLAAAVWCVGVQHQRERFLGAATAMVLVMASPVLLSLASSFMLEVPVAVLALLSLGSVARLGDPEPQRRRWGWILIAAMTTGATLLAKYNAGLPLLPALAAVAVFLWSGGRRLVAAEALGVALLAALLWAGFLWMQEDGWQMFMAFSENRANSLGMSPWRRLMVYGQVHGNSYVVAPVVTWLMLLLSGYATWRRPSPWTIAAAVYIGGTVTALALHPYVLGRNLFVAAVVAAVLTAVGFAALFADLSARRPQVRHLSSAVGVAMAILLVTLASGRARSRVESMYHGQDQALARLSQVVGEELATPGSCRVVGTFNEFSAGWVRLMATRDQCLARPLRVEFPYPLNGGRSGRSDAPNPIYDQMVARWMTDGEERVILVMLDRHSPWWGEDYSRHVAWKNRLAEAFLQRDDLHRIRRHHDDEHGLHAWVLTRDDSNLLYRSGWGAAEPWGRWALAPRVRLLLRGETTPVRLVFEYATGDPAITATTGRVESRGQVLATLDAPRAWQWNRAVIDLPGADEDGLVDVTFVFDQCGVLNGQQRAMAFRNMAIEPISSGRSDDLSVSVPTFK